MELLALRGAVVGYHRKPVLPPTDLVLRRGAFLGVVGPNGSGKTTLVRTMLDLLPPVAGEIVRAPGLRFGYVPQRDALDVTFPLSALEIALMGRYGRLGFARRPSQKDREIARRALADVGAARLEEAQYHALSGGQKQRVLIARALAGEPDALILDEPTTGMDLLSERATLDLAEALRRRGLAVVMVSHHLGAVADYASELCIVQGLSRPVEVGSRASMLTSARLSEVYGQPVAVGEVAGHSAIVLASPAGAPPPSASGTHAVPAAAKQQGERP